MFETPGQVLLMSALALALSTVSPAQCEAQAPAESKQASSLAAKQDAKKENAERRVALLKALDLETASPEKRVVATYNGGSVTLVDYLEWLLVRGASDAPTLREQRVATIALNKSLAKRAEVEGVANHLDLILRSHQRKSKELATTLRQHLVTQIEITAEELKAAVAQRRSAFGTPERRRLRNLLKRYPRNATAEQIVHARAVVEGWRDRIRQGEDFAAIAKAESDSQTRFRGGMIGWVRPGSLAAEVEKVAANLDKGDLSEIFSTEDGFALLLCEDLSPASQPALVDTSKRVLKNLKREQLERAWQPMREQAEGVTIDTATLSVLTGGTLDSATGRKVVAQVGDFELTAAQAFSVLPRRPDENPADWLSNLTPRLRTTFEETLAAQQARALGLTLSPTVERKLRWARIAELSAQVVLAQVRNQFVPIETEEAEAYYREHPSAFKRPAQVRLSAIQWITNRDNLGSVSRQADRVFEALSTEETSFSAAARRFSQHPSAAKGGDLGWLSRTRLAALGPNLLAAVDRLSPGGLTRPVLQPAGLDGGGTMWIIRRVASRKAGTIPFNEAQELARNLLGKAQARALEQRIRQSTSEQIDLRVDRQFVDALP